MTIHYVQNMKKKLLSFSLFFFFYIRLWFLLLHFYFLKVTIGKNLKFLLGFLKYEEAYLVPPVESTNKLFYSL